MGHSLVAVGGREVWREVERVSTVTGVELYMLFITISGIRCGRENVNILICNHMVSICHFSHMFINILLHLGMLLPRLT